MLSGSTPAPNLSIDLLLELLVTGSARQRRSLIKTIQARVDDLAKLGPSVLDPFDPNGDDWAPGWILQVLQRYQPDAVTALLTDSTKGWFTVESAIGLDFAPLQRHLLHQDFEAADRLTSDILRQLAGEAAVQRGYVYFSEVSFMQGIDLVSVDRLWTVYSQGRFGFTAQARLLKTLKGRYDQLWQRIGWKRGGVWTRYPDSFTWSMEAPEGHMPLINQLRGVRLMDAVLRHPALIARQF
ncbi:GUN4 domain-containing protein [Synechococcus sp. M16CYN]|uniref:GUN4 domain-containing protein n=1 Tax=Synechococcus sp. M16CYN TaxID=3103139 RepID=UPI00324F9992